ncbi:MAG: hypothetical protein WBM17_09690 [Anaerolineales bacterium]|jgi:hypothetical protein
MTNDTNSNGRTHIQERENRQSRNIVYWLPLGIGTGVALGVMFENLALGIAIGAAVGAALGMAANLSRKGAADLDTGTPAKRWIAIAVGGVVFLAVVAILLYFLMR